MKLLSLTQFRTSEYILFCQQTDSVKRRKEQAREYNVEKVFLCISIILPTDNIPRSTSIYLQFALANSLHSHGANLGCSNFYSNLQNKTKSKYAQHILECKRVCGIIENTMEITTAQNGDVLKRLQIHKARQLNPR
jgi:hypothetical protein